MFKFFQKNKRTEDGPAQPPKFPFGLKVRAATDAKNFSAGFTLVELLVSIAIIGLITAIAIFNQSDLSDQVALGNVANDIELELRSTQVYGISVREFAPATQEFSIAYGTDFKILGTGSNNKAFYTFADRTVNGYFETWGTCTLGGTSECVAYNTISRGNYVSKLCVIQSNSTEVCSPTIGRIAVTFLRPNPAARIVFMNSSNGILSYPGYLGARIEITSPKGATKSVIVYTTGQISIQ